MSGPLKRLRLLPWLVACTGPLAFGQDLEPRRWSHLPSGLRVIGGGYAYTDGDLFLDPVLQIEDATVEIHTAVASYVHSFSLGGKSARVDVRLPYQDAKWSGQLAGDAAERRSDGFGDPRIRLSVNLVGAPPLAGREYLEYRGANPVTTTLGAAVAVTLPLGQYDPDRLLNLGTNRFSVRPQVGVLHTRGLWSYELTGSVFLFTDNNDFFGGNTLQRDPVYALQTHVVRSIGKGWWVAAGAGWGLGGETEINGVNSNNHIGDFLAGASLGVPVAGNQSLKLAYLRSRTQELVGGDADTLLIGWSVRL